MSTVVLPNAPAQKLTDADATAAIQRHLADVANIDVTTLRAEAKALEQTIATDRSRLVKCVGLISLHGHTMDAVNKLRKQHPNSREESE